MNQNLIISPDARGQIDWSVNTNILQHLPDDLRISIVPISWFPDFKFVPPPELKTYPSGHRLMYILIDFMEPHSDSTEYDQFWAWVKENPPELHFKRELHKKDVSDILKPIEFACYLEIPDVQTKEQFDARPIEVLYFWGMSHRDRPRLHGEIFEGMGNKGIEVVDNWNDVDRFWMDTHKYDGNWVSVYAPYWRRRPMNYITPLMEKSKICVAMPGNGKKTFRHAESVGTILATMEDDLAWAYPWDETNSIGLCPTQEFSNLIEATKRSDLYDIYLAYDQNMRRYEARTYANEYVATEIRKVL